MFFLDKNREFGVLLPPMKKMYIVVIGVIVLIAQSCQQKETLTREEVVAAIERFDEGWKNKNAGTVNSVLSPSYVYFTQSGGTFDRKNIVETAASSNYKLEKVKRQQYDIKLEGNVAIVNTVWYGKGSYYGTKFNDSQRCSITLIKKNGKVEILSEHCTPIK